MTSLMGMRRRAMKVAAAGPTVLASDDFNRADSSLLGTSSSGHAWTEDAAWAVIANQAGIETAGSGGALADVEVGASDVEASVVVPALVGYVGVTARKSDADNFYLTQSGTADVELYKRAAATWTLLGSAGPPTAGDTLSVRCLGTAISAKVNGVAVVSVTDSSISAGSRAGLRNGSAGTTIRWDDFKVEAA